MCLINIIPVRWCQSKNIREGLCYYISPKVLHPLLLSCPTGRAGILLTEGFEMKMKKRRKKMELN